MKTYLCKNEQAQGALVALDDMMLTASMPTTAGSKMLDGYMSLFGASVIGRLKEAGYDIAGKVNVGEFDIDVLGETSAFGAAEKEDGTYTSARSEAVLAGDIDALVGLDVSGAFRRGAALSGLFSMKPTYGTVSRFGTIPVACSGETVSVMSKDAARLKAVLTAIKGHDDGDGTSFSEEICLSSVTGGSEIKKVAIASSLFKAADAKEQLEAMKAFLQKAGITAVEVDDSVLLAAQTAWNICLCAELCNNVSRYDGVKFGYRTKEYSNIDELYTGSRTEAFGELLKTAILFGSETLSTENYFPQYDKALRIRRVVVDRFNEIFKDFDAVLMPVCSRKAYTDADFAADKYLAFEENKFTAPASISGLPALVMGGLQFVAPAFADGSLLKLAADFEKEGM